MHDRFQYLRLLYTCMYEGMQGDPTLGTTCFDPVFYYTPNDDKAYDDMESTFIFGGAVKVSPVLANLTADQKTIVSYFPLVNGMWVSLLDHTQILGGGKSYELDATIPSAHAHLMPGKVIPFQSNGGERYKSTAQLINSTVELIVNPDSNGYAEGSLFLDMGSSVKELNDQAFEYYRLQMSSGSLQV
jgi:alpha-glucosidase (family GH31 glycosyl hydrolase)